MASYLDKKNISKSAVFSIIATVFFCLSTPSAHANTEPTPESISIDERIELNFIGDLDEIRKRRILRVLVSQSRTNFFYTDKGTRGIEHDLMKEFEDYLNRGPLRERYKTHVVFLPLPFEQLIDHLVQGHGDIAAAGLTITQEREQLVNFTHPYIKNVNEILVTHKNNQTELTDIRQLSGQRVLIVSNSSYAVQLQIVNQALGAQGLEPIEIVLGESGLEAEDILELVNSELFDYTVVDSHIAKIYHNIFPNLKLVENFVFRNGGQIGWAINKNLPKLEATLNHFIDRYARPGKFLGNSLFRKYFENPFWIRKPINFSLLGEKPCLEYYFEKYASFYDFDPYLIQAQAYQESRFRQNLVSPKNARGIMQIKPSTARSKIVGIRDISKPEDNIHAGVRYLAYLHDEYFDKPEYTPDEQMNFSLAAYNAGPGRIRQLQRIAKRKGLDPHKWFYNVEVIARNEIGHETVNYVTEIQKRKIAFKLAADLERQKRADRMHQLTQEQIEEIAEAITEEEKQQQTPLRNLFENDPSKTLLNQTRGETL